MEGERLPQAGELEKRGFRIWYTHLELGSSAHAGIKKGIRALEKGIMKGSTT